MNHQAARLISLRSFANLAVKLCNQLPDGDLRTATSRCSQPLRGQHHADDIDPSKR